MGMISKAERQHLFAEGRCQRCKEVKSPLKTIHDNKARDGLVVAKATDNSKNFFCPDCLARRRKEMEAGLKLRAEGRLPAQTNGKAKPKPAAKKATAKPTGKAKAGGRKRQPAKA